MISFNDIFKKSFIDGFAGSEAGALSMLGAMFTCTLFAVFIFLVYRVLTRRSFYSHNFAITLVGVTYITAAIILTIQSSIVVSLGMVGALSIVRFRAAIKDPMDLMFLFWAISNGIMCGAGLAEYALILAVVLTVVVVILQLVPAVRPSVMLVINAAADADENAIMDAIQAHAAHASIKARSIGGGRLDLTVELRTEQGQSLVDAVSSLDGVDSVTLLSHDGGTVY